MTKEEELSYYEKALVDYVGALSLSDEEIEDSVFEDGLCYYFMHTHSIDIYCAQGALPVLECLIEEISDGVYIAPHGELKPRIHALKQAIATVKQQIHEQTTQVSN
jgi:hypothetical protein